MRPSLAKGNAHQQGKTLILGNDAVARQIAHSLTLLGQDPVLWKEFSSEELPTPWHPDSISQLKGHLLKAKRLSVIHPGISSWAERPELPTIGQELGISVISPPPKVLSFFINKLSLIGEAHKLKIPHLVQKFELIQSHREFLKLKEIRYPLILKAARSGGGYGIFVAQSEDDIRNRLSLWLEQLRKNFGEVSLFVEKYVDTARHIVKPFARFSNGEFKGFCPMDCSLQRRHRKIVEICPPPSLDPEVDVLMNEWSHQLADRLGYVGVGQFEFIVDGNQAFFVDGSARLSTGFHLWESVSGVSAVEWQLATMQLASSPLTSSSHAWKAGISGRIYAEDSLYQLPQPGTIHELSQESILKQPGLQGEIRWALQSGETISSTGDPLLGLVQLGSHDYRSTLSALSNVLSTIWILGDLQTNERFLKELVTHPWVTEGVFHAGFVEEEFIPRSDYPRWVLDAGLSALKGLFPKIHQWMVGSHVFQSSSLESKISLTEIKTLKPEVHKVVLRIEGHPSFVNVGVVAISDEIFKVRVEDWFIKFKKVSLSDASKPTQPLLKSLVTGKIYSLLFQKNTLIKAHEPLVLVESLGMLIPHAVPYDVKVLDWKVESEQLIQEGHVIATLERVERKEV